MIRRFLLLRAAALMLLGAAAIASTAAPAAADPAQFVSNLASKAITGLTSSQITANQRNSEFRRLLTQNFDVPAIGRFVLGRYWREATEAEQQEYQKLFEDMLVATYAGRFSDYAGEKLKIVQSRAGQGDTVVVTDMDRPQGAPVRVDWRVRPHQGSYRIYDVIVEGVSMSITQRDEFASVIQRGGGKVSALLAQLREKTRGLSAAR